MSEMSQSARNAVDQQASEMDLRRAAARRTAYKLGGIALLVFVLFCLKAVKVI